MEEKRAFFVTLFQNTILVRLNDDFSVMFGSSIFVVIVVLIGNK